MLARWLPLAQGYGRVACRTSKARASRAAWSPSPAHARSRSVRAHAAGGWRISDSLGSGGGGSGGSDERPPGDEGSFRDGTREGREREGRGRARAPSRGYDARPRDAYDSHARGRSRGGRDDLRHHDPGFSSRDSSRDSSSSSRVRRKRPSRPSRPSRPRRPRRPRRCARGRGRGDRGGRGRGARASFRDDFRDRSFYGVKRGGDGRRGEPRRTPRRIRFLRRGVRGRRVSRVSRSGQTIPQRRPLEAQRYRPERLGLRRVRSRTTSRGATRVSGAEPRGRRRRAVGPYRTARLATRETRGSTRLGARSRHARRSLKTIRSNGGGTPAARATGGTCPARVSVGRVGRRIGTRADPGGLLPVLRDVPPRAGRGGRRRAARVPDRGAGRPRGRLRRVLRGHEKDGRSRQRVAAQRCSRAGRAAARVAGQLRARRRRRVRLRPVRRAVARGGARAHQEHVLVREPRVELHGRHLDSAPGGDAGQGRRLRRAGGRQRLAPAPPARGHASADVPMFLSLYRDEATLYRDMSGESLHRRGYRDAAIHRAALNESAAAGVLALAGWADACDKARRSTGADPQNEYALPVLVDPMCGSGTLLIEAALLAGMVAPGLVRADARGAWPRGGGFERKGPSSRTTAAAGSSSAETQTPTLRTRSSGGPITTAPCWMRCSRKRRRSARRLGAAARAGAHRERPARRGAGPGPPSRHRRGGGRHDILHAGGLRGPDAPGAGRRARGRGGVLRRAFEGGLG